MTRRFRSGLVVVINVAVVSCSATSDQNRDPMNEAAEATPVYEPLVVAANLITPAKRLEAVSLVTEGITLCHSNISCS